MRPSRDSKIKNPEGIHEKTQHHRALAQTLYHESNTLRSRYQIKSPDSVKIFEKKRKTKQFKKSLSKEDIKKDKHSRSSQLTLQIFHNRVIRDVNDNQT